MCVRENGSVCVSAASEWTSEERERLRQFSE